MRLIDADALKGEIIETGQRNSRHKYKPGERWELDCEEIWQTIDNMPTMRFEDHVRNRMTAEQMFNKIDYEKLISAHSYLFGYANADESFFVFDTEHHQFDCSLESLDWDEIKAVITQMKELGLIDEVLGEAK